MVVQLKGIPTVELVAATGKASVQLTPRANGSINGGTLIERTMPSPREGGLARKVSGACERDLRRTF